MEAIQLLFSEIEIVVTQSDIPLNKLSVVSINLLWKLNNGQLTQYDTVWNKLRAVTHASTSHEVNKSFGILIYTSYQDIYIVNFS